jgi:hypothetical protein
MNDSGHYDVKAMAAHLLADLGTSSAFGPGTLSGARHLRRPHTPANAPSRESIKAHTSVFYQVYFAALDASQLFNHLSGLDPRSVRARIEVPGDDNAVLRPSWP